MKLEDITVRQKLVLNKNIPGVTDKGQPLSPEEDRDNKGHLALGKTGMVFCSAEGRGGSIFAKPEWLDPA